MNKMISIVIPSTRPYLLKQTLATIAKQPCLEVCEVIICANDNREEIKEIVNSFVNPSFFYHETPERYELLESWQYAYKFATGKYVTILGDDDAIVKNGIAIMVEAILQGCEYISLGVCYYGHPNMDDIGRNGLRFDMTWQNVGRIASKDTLDHFFKLNRGVFCPTHCLVKRDILSGCHRVFGPLFPDHYFSGLGMLGSTNVLLTKQPVIIHGYSIDSSAYLMINSKHKVIKWGEGAIKYSPVQAHVFANGWLETLLTLKLDYPDEFANCEIDYTNFFTIYSRELLEEACYRDVNSHYIELEKAIRNYGVESEDVKRTMDGICKLMKLGIWKNYYYYELWVPGDKMGFSNIVGASGMATDIYNIKCNLPDLR